MSVEIKFLSGLCSYLTARQARVRRVGILSGRAVSKALLHVPHVQDIVPAAIVNGQRGKPRLAIFIPD